MRRAPQTTFMTKDEAKQKLIKLTPMVDKAWEDYQKADAERSRLQAIWSPLYSQRSDLLKFIELSERP